ncbi:MAG: ribosome biogenesis GTPase Der [Bdellovibrionales bacterium]|nr:ribosome biogenesis GTPase Der [Bdellovibrionales bacterium]
MLPHNLSRVAVIGRPNVGKSTLFNKLTRTRKALVKNQPGVTRDILVESAEWWGFHFEMMDTGGITDDKEGFSPLIKQQVLAAIESVGALVVIVDGRVGFVPEDDDIIRIAKESAKPFLIVVNKIDNILDADIATAEFYKYGMDVIPAAFERDFGIDEIVEWIRIHAESKQEEQSEGIRLCIIGKPNAGKSSLCNQFLKKERMLVSPVSGTTADSVEESFEYGDQIFHLVDTAGLRRNSKRDEGVERLSAHKTKEAIRKSDVVLLLVDALDNVSVQEARMVEYCIEQHKAIILVANKIDLAEKNIEHFREQFRYQVARQFHFFPDIPLEFVSAKTGKGVDRLLSHVIELNEKLHKKIPTSKLNQFFMDVIRGAPAPVFGTKDVKFYYLTQTGQVPPSFIAFANEPRGVTPAYRRFISKRLAEAFDLQGVPLRIFVMKKRRSKRKGPALDSENQLEQLEDLAVSYEIGENGDFELESSDFYQEEI